jgi:hypothetical protein
VILLHISNLQNRLLNLAYVPEGAMKIIIILVFLFPLNVIAHEDTIIKRDGDKLLGLPSIYEPAMFKEKYLELSLGNKSVVFPKCIHELFALKDDEDIVVEASWYHEIEPDGLPPYISLRKSSNSYNLEKSLLINMDTLYPIDSGFTYGLQDSEKACLKKFKPEIRE